MPNLKKRSHRKELLDNIHIPEDILIQNLTELDWLNKHMNGHRISIKGLKKLKLKKCFNYTLLDIGCGSGDSMLHMAKWARKHNYNIKFTGIDINPLAIKHLNTKCSEFPEIKGITANCFDYLKQQYAFDIVHASLFCHHLQDDELISFFSLINKKLRKGIIINDLRRSRTAWYGAKWFTKLMNGSNLSQHDGPVSVLNAFKKSEMEHYLRESGMSEYEIKKQWPYRFLITSNLRNED